MWAEEPSTARPTAEGCPHGSEAHQSDSEYSSVPILLSNPLRHQPRRHSRLRLQPLHDHLAKGADVGEFVAAFGVEEGDLVVTEEAGDIAV